MRSLDNFSLMKCLSISICFVLSCCTGSFAILIASLLSQNNLIGFLVVILKSSNNVLSHINSHTPNAIALYSASTLNLATTDYFLLLQVTRLPLTNEQYLDVERRSFIELAQSARENFNLHVHGVRTICLFQERILNISRFYQQFPCDKAVDYA